MVKPNWSVHAFKSTPFSGDELENTANELGIQSFLMKQRYLDFIVGLYQTQKYFLEIERQSPASSDGNSSPQAK